MRDDQGGPAFPGMKPDAYGQDSGHVPGMTLRDYFAAKAMSGYRANGHNVTSEKVATWSYEDADAMLAARTAGRDEREG